MNPEKQNSGSENDASDERTDRREALIQMGKFAAYAAPFTVLALTRADAATGYFHTGK
jgi:hypothetical protein